MAYWQVMTIRLVRKTLRWVTVVCSFAPLIGVGAAEAGKGPYYVSICTEAGLNNALRLVKDDDVIKFKCDGTIKLSKVEKITHRISVDASARTITLDGQENVAIFEVAPGAALSIIKLTLVNAGWNLGFTGHAIENFGTVWVEQSTFLDNIGANGGAIENVGALTVQDSYFESNRAVGEADPHQWGSGGAISNEGGTVIVSNSTFVNNRAGDGGAIYNSGVLTIDRSLFTQNQAARSNDCLRCGGAVTNTDVMQNGVMIVRGLMVMRNSVVYANNEYGVINFGVATIINSTIAQNTVTNPSIFSTIAQNTAANPNHPLFFDYANIVNWNVMTLRGTILAVDLPYLPDNNAIYQSQDFTNCSDWAGNHQGIIDGGENLQYPDSSCGHNMPVADPKLTPLGDYGFATTQGADRHAVQILGLQADSPAIHNGFCNPNPDEVTDGRGFPRPAFNQCDIGAFEFDANGSTPTPTYMPNLSPTAAALK